MIYFVFKTRNYHKEPPVLILLDNNVKNKQYNVKHDSCKVFKKRLGLNCEFHLNQMLCNIARLAFRFEPDNEPKSEKKNGRNLNKKTGRSIRGILKAFCNPKVPNFSPRSGRIMVRLKVDVATSKII